MDHGWEYDSDGQRAKHNRWVQFPERFGGCWDCFWHDSVPDDAVALGALQNRPYQSGKNFQISVCDKKFQFQNLKNETANIWKLKK